MIRHQLLQEGVRGGVLQYEGEPDPDQEQDGGGVASAEGERQQQEGERQAPRTDGRALARADAVRRGVERPEDRPDPRRGHENPVPVGPAAEDLPRVDRDQHVVRHGEKRRQGDEDDDGARQALLPEVPHPAEKVLRGFVPSAGAADEGHVHQEQAEEDGEEARPVDEEGACDARDGDQHPGRGGTEDARGVECPGVEGDGVRQVLPPHQLHDEGLPGGGVQRLHGPEEEGEEEDVPEANRPGPAEGGEQEREDHHRGLAPEDHLSLLEAVHDRPGVEGEGNERDRPDEVHDPEVPRRAGELVHEPVLGDRLHPGADQRGELAEEPEAEVAVAQPPERRGDRAVRRNTYLSGRRKSAPSGGSVRETEWGCPIHGTLSAATEPPFPALLPP